ncbi:hypothetical protein B296_00042499 [Ensete ventricosum]|uniref:Uncharacterized protein n=1 Tax=Ensete ventricosum TaxID=4639 RepID=A0A426XXT3_ENSVE|nr:hypothetical protein B296_00042499 [Ensete ventricosum]
MVGSCGCGGGGVVLGVDLLLFLLLVLRLIAEEVLHHLVPRLVHHLSPLRITAPSFPLNLPLADRSLAPPASRWLFVAAMPIRSSRDGRIPLLASGYRTV